MHILKQFKIMLNSFEFNVHVQSYLAQKAALSKPYFHNATGLNISRPQYNVTTLNAKRLRKYEKDIFNFSD